MSKPNCIIRIRRFIAPASAVLYLTCVFLLSASCAARTPAGAELPFTLEQVGPNVWAAISNPKSAAPAGANMGFVIGDDGVAVLDASPSFDADGNFRTEPAKQLLVTIRSLTKLPVRFVINTHHHLDHVGANAVFADAGAITLAQRNVRGWIHTENLRMFGEQIKPHHKAFIEALLPPTVTFEQSMDLYLGSREIRLRSFPGHTGGDSVLLIPGANVVFAGDLFWRNILPNLIDASILPWIDTLDTLAKNNADATFVPGHGDVGNAHDVAAFGEYLATLRRLVSDAQALGKSGAALVDAVMPALSDKYNGWDSFKDGARPNILETDAELSGRKRIPQPTK